MKRIRGTLLTVTTSRSISTPLQRYSRMIAILLLMLGSGVFAVRMHLLRRQQANLSGKLTAEQIIQRSAPICQAFLSEGGKVSITASFMRLASYSIWTVQCIDQNDQDIVTLDWNADTGELEYVSVPGNFAQLKMRPLALAQAHIKADYWLKALGVNRCASWHFDLNCFKQSHVWIAHYCSRERDIWLRIDGRSGRLCYASLRSSQRDTYYISPQSMLSDSVIGKRRELKY